VGFGCEFGVRGLRMSEREIRNKEIQDYRDKKEEF
jgi:hypothetical protein